MLTCNCSLPVFSKIIISGYYDGATAGFAECAQCGVSLRFDLLAWDKGQDLRIYSLSPLPPSGFNFIARSLSRFEPPHWPEWFPGSHALDCSKDVIDAVLATAASPVAVMAAYCFRQPIKVVLLSADQLETVTDWFSFMGLSDAGIVDD